MIRLRFLVVAFRSDLMAVRFVLALGALFVGAGFLWPSSIFPDPSRLVAGSRTTYLYMAMIAPELAWGAAFTIQGAAMMWSLLIDYRSRLLLWVDGVLGCFLWTVAILSCYAAYWPGLDQVLEYKPPAIMGGELAMVCASWWVLVRYAFDDSGEGGNACGNR